VVAGTYACPVGGSPTKFVPAFLPAAQPAARLKVHWTGVDGRGRQVLLLPGVYALVRQCMDLSMVRGPDAQGFDVKVWVRTALLDADEPPSPLPPLKIPFLT